MREMSTRYQHIHPYVCNIHGDESDITIDELDGEYIICRQENEKVFPMDDDSALTHIIGTLLNRVYSCKNWLSRLHYDLVKLIMEDKLPPMCITPYASPEHIAGLTFNYIYFIQSI